MMFSEAGTFLNDHPFLSQLHNVCPDFAEHKVCNIAPGLHRPVITAPSEDLYETALARLLRDDTTGLTGEQMLAKAAKLGYRLEDPEKFAEFLRPGSLSCYGASQGDTTIRIPLVPE
ncbi:hypothetical protein QCA50_015341 [Cerrena zonata]|uniref:Uncharacterized protein n=1 Tax=Cerrena zonata TaxID=2478898 RepID=A0AAW0FIR7_9APHY